MKIFYALLLAALVSACSSYGSHGTGEGGRETGKNGYTVKCDDTPPNQPGCYSPPPSYSWGFLDKFKFGIGAQ